MKFKVFCFAVMFAFACVNCFFDNIGAEIMCLFACYMLWTTMRRS